VTCSSPILHDVVGCDCAELEAPPPPAPATVAAWFARNPGDALALIVGERARRSLAVFFREAFVNVIEPGTPYEHGPHVDAICDHVQWQLEERARAVAEPSHRHPCLDLLVNMPPRALKTKIVQVAAIAWAWLHWPDLRVLCLSTNPKVSTEAADECRSLIRSEWYQATFAPDWQIRDDKDGVTDMKNTAGGRRAARGWDANVVGEGADWRIVDDPNDPDDVHSEVVRESVDRRWRLSIANRKTSPRTTITTGIQQRTHVDDWSARRLAEGGWIHLSLRQESDPARASSTPMPCNGNRYAAHGAVHWRDWRAAKGETLHPRFDAEFCAKERKRLGTLGYEAQHNQEPRLLEGGLFKRRHWRFWRPRGALPAARPEGASALPALEVDGDRWDWIATSTDATFGKSDRSDYVSILVIGGLGARVCVIEDLTARRDFPETLAAIRDLAKRYPYAAHLIETKANGQAIIDSLKGEIMGLIGVEPKGGKESRAQATAPAVEAGDVYLLEGAPWLDEFVAELADFPSGRHDDRVDALTQAVIHYREGGGAFWAA